MENPIPFPVHHPDRNSTEALIFLALVCLSLSARARGGLARLSLWTRSRSKQDLSLPPPLVMQRLEKPERKQTGSEIIDSHRDGKLRSRRPDPTPVDAIANYEPENLI